MSKYDKYNKLYNLLDELRTEVFNLTPTKDDEVSESEDISKNKILDDAFDIDIFFSRKPGMRRSVQFISSDAANKDNVRISAMTAICSLLDTIVGNGILTLPEVCTTILTWVNKHTE